MRLHRCCTSLQCKALGTGAPCRRCPATCQSQTPWVWLCYDKACIPLRCGRLGTIAVCRHERPSSCLVSDCGCCWRHHPAGHCRKQPSTPPWDLLCIRVNPTEREWALCANTILHVTAGGSSVQSGQPPLKTRVGLTVQVCQPCRVPAGLLFRRHPPVHPLPEARDDLQRGAGRSAAGGDGPLLQVSGCGSHLLAFGWISVIELWCWGSWRPSPIALRCRPECEARFCLRSSGGALRRALFKLERGVCILCKLDCHDLVKRVRWAIMLKQALLPSKGIKLL